MRPRATIFVTGAPRSGTTWAGRVLSEAEGVQALHEPLNPAMESTWPRVPRWFVHIGEHNSSQWHAPVERALQLRYPLARNVAADRTPAAIKRHLSRWLAWREMARSASQLVVKDPIAVFSSEWLCRTFGLRPVFLVRHPAGVVSSLVRLEWRPRFDQWTNDEQLMDGLLAPLAPRIARAATSEPDLLSAASLLWAATALTVARVSERLPEAIVLRYEDLAERPEQEAAALCDALGLTLTPEGLERVRESSVGEGEVDPARATQRLNRDSRAAARTWTSRLTTDEQRRVRELTEPWAAAWFDEDAWAAGGA